MSYDGMTTQQLKEAAQSMLAEIERRETEEADRNAVVSAVQAYADSQGLTLLEAWTRLIPEGLDVPEEPEPLPEAPEWVAPTGAHDAYAAGDLVTFRDRVYESLMDGNSWSPAAYPQGWKEVR